MLITLEKHAIEKLLTRCVDCLQHFGCGALSAGLMLSCQVALTVVIHIGDCENITKIPFNSPCTRCYTCTSTHRCKHSSVLSVNARSQGTLKGPEARQGRPLTSQHLRTDVSAHGTRCTCTRTLSRWWLMKPSADQRDPAGLSHWEVKPSYRL